MLDIKKSSAKNTAGLLNKAITVAKHFGFNDINEILENTTPTKLKAANKVHHANTRDKAFMPVMRKLMSRNIHRSKNDVLGYNIQSDKTSDTFTLHVLNTRDPIAEATIIATATTLMKDSGFDNTMVHINSYGTNESFTRYVRDLNKYFKKILRNLPAQIVTDLAVSPIRAYAKLHRINPDLAAGGPTSVDYLNDEGRTHLWGVLEYLEELDIPYILDNSVMGGSDYFEHTMFELRHDDYTDALAFGGRYDVLSRKAYRKQMHATGLMIEIPKTGASKPKRFTQKQPKFYFAQLGNTAKKLGLRVLRILHDSNIEIAHNITVTKMSKQMSNPILKQVPYVIIIGQKEAINNTAIVRDTSTHKQKVVPINKLVNYLKKLT